jgi:hypothetical protein
MAVYWRVTNETPILSGHWVCPKSIQVSACCRRPREVTKTSNTTVSWRDDELGMGHCGKSSIAFFADSAEEAMAVYKLEKAKHDAIEEATNRIAAEYDAQIEAVAPGNPHRRDLEPQN